jgi:flavin-binding protein dodecin
VFDDAASEALEPAGLGDEVSAQLGDRPIEARDGVAGSAGRLAEEAGERLSVRVERRSHGWPVDGYETHGATLAFHEREEHDMAQTEGHIYRTTEVIGTSSDSIQAAVRAAVQRAHGTLRNLDWFEVGDIRGTIRDGDVGEFQVSVKIGFRLD